MSVTFHLLFVVLALLLFALAALGIPEPARFKFIAAGLFFWLLSSLVIR